VVTGTLPFEIEGSFKALGYSKVINDTYSTAIWKADEKNLRAASELWKKQYCVVLCVNDNVFSTPDDSSLKPNHFCTLKSQVAIGTNVKCRVWQWGLSKKEPEDGVNQFLNLKKDTFIKHYFGHVAAGDV